MHPQVLRSATTWLANKHETYTKYMVKVVTHIVEGFLIHKQLDEIDQLDQTEKDKRVYYQPLKYPKESDTACIDTIAHLGHFSKYMRDDNTIKHLHGFLEILKYKNRMTI